MKLIIYTDGGARGNPGPAAIGIVISDAQNKVLEEIQEYIGIGTNNQAEYKALLRGLREVLNKYSQTEEVLCYLDSELVVKQLTGLYKIKEPGLQLLASEILALTGKFKKIEFKHVPREQNSQADKLVNQALDQEEEKNKTAAE